MTSALAGLHVRPATPGDVAPLCDLLNVIIGIGGTTALEQPLTEAQFNEYFLEGVSCLSCLVAEASDRGVLGFQVLGRHADLPSDWADVGTFARAEPKTPGVGTALFAASRTLAADMGVVAINATIRADNRGGLAYYEKMGFRTYRTLEAVKLQDGRAVDRILKRYLVER
jgi:L-amino acid N-acyltransferase YncA